MKKRTAVVTILMAICMIMTIIGFVGCKDDGGGETPDPVRNVTLSQTQVTLDRYENITLTATVTDEAGNAVSDAVTWATSNAAVATVSGGFVQATGEGSADITASVGAAKATCKVTVESSGMEPVLSLDAESVSVVVGGEFTVRGAVMYNRVEQTDAVITYTMADTNIATVDGEGSITGVSYGSTTLTVSASWRGVESSFLTEQIPVTVKENISLTITGENATIYLKNTTVEDEVFSNTVTYTGTVLVAGSEQGVDESKIAWKSSDDTIATVSNGVVTATGDKEGSVQITMTYTGEEVYSSAPVTVTVAMPTLDKTDEITLYLDANATDKTVGGQITAAEVFGSDTDKTIERIANNDDTATDISENATWITERDTGSEDERTYTLAVYNDEYGYLVNAVVATKVITTYTELTQMQEYGGVQSVTTSANKTYYNYSGYFVLGDDIVIQPSDPVFEVDCVTGFGSQSELVAANGFSGTFNGNGHTIYNLKTHHSGLLGDIANGSVIKNLALVNVTVTGNADNSGAGVIGFSSYGATIENVFISMSTSAARSGMVGRIMAGGAIRNTVIYYEKTGGYFCGALTAWTSSTVTVDNVYVIYSATTAEADRTLKGETAALQLSGTVTEYDEEDLATASFSGLPEGWYVAEGGYPMFESSIGGMYISQTTLTGTVGGQGSLQGYVYGASQSDNIGLPVVWESDNPDAVQVIQTGAYEFVGEGSATITVTYGKFKATCTVEVDAAAVQIVDRTGTTLDVESNSTTGLGTQIVNAGVEAELFDTFTPTAVYFESAPDTDYNDDNGTETGFFATYDTGNETARTLTLIVANGDTALYRVKVLVVTKIITTYDELTKMQEYGGVTTAQVTDGTATRTYHNYSGYFVLGGNIIVGAEEDALEVGSREGLGSQASINEDYGFNGVFDGRGYTISGLKVYHSGLFGDLAAGSVIKNVAFDNVTVTGNSDNSGAGVIAYTSCGATIENVFISMSTSSARSGAFGSFMRGGTLKDVVIYYEKTGGYFCGALTAWTASAVTVENVYVIYTTTTPEADRKLASEQTILSNGTVTEYQEENLSEATFTGLSDTYWTVTAGEMPTFNSMADIESA